MIRRPPRSTRTDTLFPYTTLFRSLINAQGRYFVDDREALRTDVESLKQTIVEVAGDDRERTVLIRADARTPWQAVITAYDALGQLGFRRIANRSEARREGKECVKYV